jgi:hypothetical protein
MTKEINEENIRVAAYYIWEQAGRPEGKDKECWIRACEQLFAPKKSVKVAAKKVASKAAPKKAAKPAKKSEPVKVAAKPAVKKPAKPTAVKVAPKATAKKSKAAPFYGSRK